MCSAGFLGSALRDLVLTRQEEELILQHLHTVLRPFLLRRLKQDVLGSLPRKEERLVYCPVSALQVRLYENIRDKLRPGNLKGVRVGQIFRRLREVRGHAEMSVARRLTPAYDHICAGVRPPVLDPKRLPRRGLRRGRAVRTRPRARLRQARDPRPHLDAAQGA
jgi:hypothetical protein